MDAFWTALAIALLAAVVAAATWARTQRGPSAQWQVLTVAAGLLIGGLLVRARLTGAPCAEPRLLACYVVMLSTPTVLVTLPLAGAGLAIHAVARARQPPAVQWLAGSIAGGLLVPVAAALAFSLAFGLDQWLLSDMRPLMRAA